MSHFIKSLFVASIFSISFFLSHESVAAGVGLGFSQGNEIKTTIISGYVTTFCPNQFGGGQQISTVTCQAQLWTPDITDYFVGPKADADGVVLTSNRADGSQRTKDSGYDGVNGVSKSRFNLGISTLTQKPLLKSGKNTIQFALTKEGTPVAQGEFIATVTPQPERRCHAGTFTGFNPYDCQDTYRICDRYFEQENWCH